MQRHVAGFFFGLFFTVHAIEYEVSNTDFSQRSYDEIGAHFRNLAVKFPHLIEVTTADKLFPANESGVEFRQPQLSCGDEPCEFLIANIGLRSAHIPFTPVIYISGAVHGDERIGPNVVAELATFLVENAQKNPKVDFLLRKRSIWVTPMTNPWGYYHNKRTELDIDINRDFPYLVPPANCMKSLGARMLNELFRSHIFSIGITFHGGTRALTYEWGSPNHMTPYSKSDRKFMGWGGGTSTEAPDMFCQRAIAQAMKQAAGVSSTGQFWYPIGAMTDLVYEVAGGFEDWAYAASWESSPTPISQCRPSSFGGYPLEKTTYSKNRLRTVMYLVETDHLKNPSDNTYGSSQEILEPAGNNGHIARNLRMSLKIIELAHPEILISAHPPSQIYAGLAAEIEVTFAGCFHVNAFQIWMMKGDCEKLTEEEALRRTSSSNVIDSTFERFVALRKRNATHPLELSFVGQTNDYNTFEDEPLLLLYNYTVGYSGQKGNGGTHTHNMSAKSPPTPENGLKCKGLELWNENKDASQNGEDFHRAKFHLPKNYPTVKSCIFLQGLFDQNWKTQQNPDPPVFPQSHLARSRLEKDYFLKLNGERIAGSSYRFFPQALGNFTKGIPINVMPAPVIAVASVPINLETSKSNIPGQEGVTVGVFGYMRMAVEFRNKIKDSAPLQSVYLNLYTGKKIQMANETAENLRYKHAQGSGRYDIIWSPSKWDYSSMNDSGDSARTVLYLRSDLMYDPSGVGEETNSGNRSMDANIGQLLKGNYILTVSKFGFPSEESYPTIGDADQKRRDGQEVADDRSAEFQLGFEVRGSDSAPSASRFYETTIELSQSFDVEKVIGRRISISRTNEGQDNGDDKSFNSTNSIGGNAIIARVARQLQDTSLSSQSLQPDHTIYGCVFQEKSSKRDTQQHTPVAIKFGTALASTSGYLVFEVSADTNNIDINGKLCNIHSPSPQKPVTILSASGCLDKLEISRLKTNPLNPIADRIIQVTQRIDNASYECLPGETFLIETPITAYYCNLAALESKSIAEEFGKHLCLIKDLPPLTFNTPQYYRAFHVVVIGLFASTAFLCFVCPVLFACRANRQYAQFINDGPNDDEGLPLTGHRTNLSYDTMRAKQSRGRD